MSKTPDPARLQGLADQAQALDRQAFEMYNASQREDAAAAAQRPAATGRELHAVPPGPMVAPHFDSMRHQHPASSHTQRFGHPIRRRGQPPPLCTGP